MNLTHLLRQRTNYPFLWREFSNAYLVISMSELGTNLKNWKLYYSKFKEKDLTTINDFTQINTGLGIEYYETSPSIYRNSENKLVVTFLAGNPDLEIDNIPYQIITSTVESLSGTQASPIELFDNVENYKCVCDTKKYTAIVGDTVRVRNNCIIRDKSDMTLYGLKSPNPEEKIYYISQYNKSDTQFIITTLIPTQYRSFIYDISTNKAWLLSLGTNQLYLPTISNNVMFYVNDSTSTSDIKEVCLSNEVPPQNEQIEYFIKENLTNNHTDGDNHNHG